MVEQVHPDPDDWDSDCPPLALMPYYDHHLRLQHVGMD